MNKENSTTKIDVEIGDFVVVNDVNMGIVDKEMVVVDVNPPDHYKAFKGDNCIRVEDKHCVTYTVSENQYTRTSKVKPNTVQVKDRIAPIHRDKGTSQPFYIAVETGQDSVSFFDDNQYKRTIPLEKVRLITEEDTLDCLQHVSEEMNKLKQVFLEVNRLLANDIQHSISKFDN